MSLQKSRVSKSVLDLCVRGLPRIGISLSQSSRNPLSNHLPSPSMSSRQISVSLSVWSPHSSPHTHGSVCSLRGPVKQHSHKAQMNLTPAWQPGHLFGNNSKLRVLPRIISTQPFLFCCQLWTKTKLICIAGCFYCLQGQQWHLKPRKALTSAGVKLWVWCRSAEPGSSQSFNKKTHGQPKLLHLRLNWRPLRCGWWRDKHWKAGILDCPQGLAHFKTSKS